MGAMQRRKGAVGERDWAEYLRSKGYEARRGVQFQGGPDSPDVMSEIEWVHWEVKRCERLLLYKALDQANSERKEGQMPIVAHRQNNKEWVCILKADDLMELIRMSHTIRCTPKKVGP